MILDERRERLLLGAVLLLALALRVWGSGFGLPYTYHVDEISVVRRALAFGTGDLNPHSFHWPAFHLYVLFALYGLLFVGGRTVGAFASLADFRNLYFTDPTMFYLAGRWLSALLGTATVYLVWRAGRRLAGPVAGLAAALCLALTYYHVRDSHLATLDVPAAFWATLAFAAAAEILRAPEVGPLAWRLGGAAAGLAAATKYNAGIVLLAVLAAHALRVPRPSPRRLADAGLCAAVAFLAATPYNLIDWRTFVHDYSFQRVHMTEGHWGIQDGAAWRIYLNTLGSVSLKNTAIRLFDPMGTLLLVATAGAFLGARRREAFFASLVPVAYLAYIGGWGMAATRYLDPIFPMLAVATGIGLAALPPAALLPALAALIFSLRAAIVSDYVLGQPDTRTLAKEWIEATIPSGATIALEGHGPPLAPSPGSLRARAEALASGGLSHPTQSPARMRLFYDWAEANTPAVSYDVVYLSDMLLDLDAVEANRLPQTNYDVERLKRLGVRYVVLSGFQFGRVLDTVQARERYPKLVAFYETLARGERLVKEIRPEGWQPGPVILVYSLETRS